jgi:hypothetical protein
MGNVHEVEWIKDVSEEIFGWDGVEYQGFSTLPSAQLLVKAMKSCEGT